MSSTATSDRAGSHPVELANVSYDFGVGSLRRTVLHDISLTIESGEIVILTGPSGSGKTTLLTLIGALRSAQSGSVRVLGRELRGANAFALQATRREIGFIFQHHNLLCSLTILQNVRMGLELGSVPRADRTERAVSVLESVGLGSEIGKLPHQLSGGQKQRAAIARALVGEPALVLADEPTASLDKSSGRDVVQLLQTLAREHRVAVVLVTHDTRILDVADRIVTVEDGRLVPLGQAVLSGTQQMMGLLSDTTRKQCLSERVLELSAPDFHALLDNVTADAEQVLHATELAGSRAFAEMLDEALAAFVRRIERDLSADRVTLWLLDERTDELWSKVARDASGESIEIRIPSHSGIAGRVFRTGAPRNIEDAYEDPEFNRDADERFGYRTRGMLCVPLFDRQGNRIGVAQALNRTDDAPFDDRDREHLVRLMNSVQVLLESWHRIPEHVAAPRSRA